MAAGAKGGRASGRRKAGACPAWDGPAVAEHCDTCYLGDSTAGGGGETGRQISIWSNDYTGMRRLLLNDNNDES